MVDIPLIFLGSTQLTDIHPVYGLMMVSDRESDVAELTPASFSMDVDIQTELPSISDDVFRTLCDEEQRMDIVVMDGSGRELHIPDARVTSRVRVTGRIPRAMKKLLKKSYGADWKNYHPNAVYDCEISNRD